VLRGRDHCPRSVCRRRPREFLSFLCQASTQAAVRALAVPLIAGDPSVESKRPRGRMEGDGSIFGDEIEGRDSIAGTQAE
jgi:hypothetical protein